MTPKIHLALAIHNHQPVGNFDHVFEQVYHEAYEPFVALLERHPGVRMAFVADPEGNLVELLDRGRKQ